MDLTEKLNLMGYSATENKQLKSIDEVAEFICKHGKHGDVTITNNGEPFITTIGIYLDKVADIRYRAQLMPILTRKQEQMIAKSDIYREDRRIVEFGDEFQIVCGFKSRCRQRARRRSPRTRDTKRYGE